MRATALLLSSRCCCGAMPHFLPQRLASPGIFGRRLAAMAIWLVAFMCACLLLLWSARLAAAPPAANGQPAPNAPVGSPPPGFVPAGEGAAPAAADANQAINDAQPGEYVPTTAIGKRNWLLTRLLAENNFQGEEARSLEKKLDNMTPGQLDALVRVYQLKQRERAAAAEQGLAAAQDNLQEAKTFRDSVAQEVADWQAYRQRQYVNFGIRSTVPGAGAIGYGGPGYVAYGPGYGFSAGAAYVPGPLFSAGYGGYGYGGYGGGPGYFGAPGGGGFGYYGPFMAPYGGAYPMMGGNFYGGLGAAY